MTDAVYTGICRNIRPYYRHIPYAVRIVHFFNEMRGRKHPACRSPTKTVRRYRRVSKPSNKTFSFRKELVKHRTQCMDLTVRINGKISSAGAVKKSGFLFGNDYFGYLLSVKLIAFTSYSVFALYKLGRHICSSRKLHKISSRRIFSKKS